VERAAHAFTWDACTARWFQRAGVEPVFANPHSRRRYVFADTRPRRWPLGAIETVGMAAKLTAARARGRLRPFGEETVAGFARRVAGAAAADKLIGPALQGIYAARADRLSAVAIFGSGLPSRRLLAAPPAGMTELPERLYERLRARGVAFTFGRALARLDSSVRTVVCCDVRTAAGLVAPHAPLLAAALGRTPTTPLVSATAFFRPHPKDLDAFGVLFSRASGVGALGCLFNASIFGGRSSQRSETWIYDPVEAGWPLDRECDAPTIAQAIHADRRVLTGRGDQALTVVATHHVPGLPVYSSAILDVRRELSDRPRWLDLVGNYTGRIGLSSILAQAEALTAAAAPL
jgi:oxygen-dependent protoporphyrinogen oxidase